MPELRCPNSIKFGDLDDGVIETKCRSRRCGAQPGVVVVHRFDAVTGAFLGTRKFKDPVQQKENDNASG